MNVPFLDITGQDAELQGEILARMARVCASGQFILGPFVEEFERAFAAYCEAPHCVAVNSGTSALHLALLALGVGPGDEVITTPMTFVATAWAISYVGARPVFVDVDPEGRTLDPERLEDAITPRTRAILPVHLYGQPADMDPILEIADARGIPVVEDAAQAHGARYNGRRVGGLGRAGCFSFYPGKNLGGYGEGGALVTHDAALADRARMLRDHAQKQRYRHEAIGFNYRMDALQGAVLGVKLPHLDGWNARRRAVAAQYRERLSDCDGITLPAEFARRESVYHLFAIESDERDELAQRLREAGVATGYHYPAPVHMQPAYADLGLPEGSFPNTERLARRCLSLPMHPLLTEEQIEHVADSLRSSVRAGLVHAS
jgi:dTDP-4-amino-4,6-dideoxygalactose transaminase